MAFCGFAFGVCLTCLLHSIALDEPPIVVGLHLVGSGITLALLLSVVIN